MHGYFGHDADIGIVGEGKSLESAFESAALALFSIETEPDRIAPEREIGFEFSEDDVEIALVTWLNLLVATARAERLALGRFELTRSGNLWRGRAWGESWSERTARGVEVKGATLTMLSVEKSGETWQARCVVDV